MKEILEFYSVKDSRVKVYYSEKNEGPGVARNKALQHVKGKYMAIMDSDDFSYPKRLEFSVKYLEEHPDIDFLATG